MLPLHPEDGRSMDLRNVGMLPQHFTLKMEAAWTSETLVCYQNNSLWRWKQRGPPKRWYPTTTLQCAITQKTWTWILATMKTSNLAVYNKKCYLNCFCNIDEFGLSWQQIENSWHEWQYKRSELPCAFRFVGKNSTVTTHKFPRTPLPFPR